MMLRRVGLVEEAKMWAGSVVVEGLVSRGVGGRFVSRSAEGDEGAAQRLRERRVSNTFLPFLVIISPPLDLSRNRQQLPVVDIVILFFLALAGKAAASPTTNVVPIEIDEFKSFRSQPVAALHF